MKVVCLISFMNEGAGAQQAIMRLANQLTIRGHEVQTWFLYSKALVDTQGLPMRLFIRGRPKPWHLLCLPFRIILEMRRAQPDAVISFLPLANTLGLACAWLAGVEARVASHRVLPDSYSFVMRFIDRQLGSVGLYSVITCVSHSVKRSLDCYPVSYRARIRVIHNGIAWVGSSLTRVEARQKFGLPEKGFIWVSLGRLSKQKNYTFLLNAFAKTHDSCLAIAGDGNDREELEQLAVHLGVQSRVYFLGAIDHRLVPDLLRAGDAFVSSSLYEGQSNAVLEAMHEGLPVLANDIPEQRETIVDPETGEAAGLLAAPDNLVVWGTLLQKLSQDAALRYTLSGAARKIVSRRFTLASMIDGFEQAVVAGDIKN